MSKVAVTTETGSVYILDRKEMTWTKARHVPIFTAIAPQPVRTKGGDLHEWPKIELGKEMVLMGPPVNKLADFRQITTSYVTAIEELED